MEIDERELAQRRSDDALTERDLHERELAESQKQDPNAPETF